MLGWTRRGLDFEATVAAPAGATVAFPLVYYDFYRVESAGSALETFSSNGLLAVRVPDGVSTLSVCQRLTGVYRLGLAASALAVLGTLACAVGLRRRRAPAAALPYAKAETALE